MYTWCMSSLSHAVVALVAVVLLCAILLSTRTEAQSFHYSSGWGGAGKKRSSPSVGTEAAGHSENMDHSGADQGVMPAILERLLARSGGHPTRGMLRRTEDLKCDISLTGVINQLIQYENQLRAACDGSEMVAPYPSAPAPSHSPLHDYITALIQSTTNDEPINE